MNQEEVDTDWQKLCIKKKQGQYSSIATEQEKIYFMTKKTLFLQDKVEANPEQTKDAY